MGASGRVLRKWVSRYVAWGSEGRLAPRRRRGISQYCEMPSVRLDFGGCPRGCTFSTGRPLHWCKKVPAEHPPPGARFPAEHRGAKVCGTSPE